VTELLEAQALIDAVESADEGLVHVDGLVVDRPVVG